MLPQYLLNPTKNLDPKTGLYIGDLEDAITLEQLYVLMKNHGQITYIKLHRFPFIGKARHFAFVYFSTQEEAAKAKDELNYVEVLQKPMRITTICFDQLDKEANLFFYGFDNEVKLKKVHEFFTKWGNVITVAYSYDEKQKSRGYGWVQFEKKEDAMELLLFQEKNAETLEFEGKQIGVKQFVKKGTENRPDLRCNLYIKNFWHDLASDAPLEDQEYLNNLV